MGLLISDDTNSAELSERPLSASLGRFETIRLILTRPQGMSALGRFEAIRLILTRSLEMSALEPKVAVKER